MANLKIINKFKINKLEIYYNKLYNKYKLRANYNIQVYENSPYVIEENDYNKCPKEIKKAIKLILKDFYESNN